MDNEELNNVDIEQQVNDWFKSEIEKYCDSNGMIEANWDYQDVEALENNLPDLMEGFEGGNLIDYITEQVHDEWMDWNIDVEDSLASAIIEDVNEIKDENLRDAVSSALEDDMWDILYKNGFNGVDDGIKEHLENLKINVNITLATANELNYDMSSIIVSFGTDYLSPEYEMVDATYLDNAITYLVNQQGYSIKDLYDVLLGNADGGTFLNSVAREIENNPAEATTGLTILVNVSLDDYGKILSNEGSITVSESTEIGLYNSWIGGGSVFEIKLDKPFTFPASMAFKADYDNLTGQGSYSVGDCYGTMNDSRSGNITFDGESAIQLEDLDSVVEYVENKYGKEE